MTPDEHGWVWRRPDERTVIKDLSEGWDGHYLIVHYIGTSPDGCKYAIAEIRWYGMTLSSGMFGWRCGTPLPEPEEVETFGPLHKVQRWCVEDDAYWREHGKRMPMPPETL